MVRRTRVNCKICHGFDGNEVCLKCHNKVKIYLNSKADCYFRDNERLKSELKLYDKPIKKVFRCDLCGDTVNNYKEKNLCYRCGKEFRGRYKKITQTFVDFALLGFSIVFFSCAGATGLFLIIMQTINNFKIIENLIIQVNFEFFNIITLTSLVLFIAGFVLLNQTLSNVYINLEGD